MIAQFEQSLLEKEIGALLDYYQVDLSGLAVFIDEEFEWLVSQADKYKMAYIVNPVYTLDVKNDVPRRHGKKYNFEEADFIIHSLGDDEDFKDLYKKSDFLIKLDRNFMILGPYKNWAKENGLIMRASRIFWTGRDENGKRWVEKGVWYTNIAKKKPQEPSNP